MTASVLLILEVFFVSFTIINMNYENRFAHTFDAGGIGNIITVITDCEKDQAQNLFSEWSKGRFRFDTIGIRGRFPFTFAEYLVEKGYTAVDAQEGCRLQQSDTN